MSLKVHGTAQSDVPLWDILPETSLNRYFAVSSTNIWVEVFQDLRFVHYPRSSRHLNTRLTIGLNVSFAISPWRQWAATLAS